MSTMDSSGFSQVGRYGTICLMKRQHPDAVVTAFGIDTDELTFGRDPACGVRLYYPDISLVHCKIIFEERKAFLVVMGSSGLLIDGCKVYPNGSSSPRAAPTTIPLINNSEFEIHGKRFRFTYPPKELRAALFATPARPTHRALRLSMIQSAQVFSPCPSKDPRENLRALQSPLKNTFRTPAKNKDNFSTPPRTTFTLAGDAYKSAAKNASYEQEDDLNAEGGAEEDDIILVDGNHPRVVEDEKDLIILEDVDVPRRSGASPIPLQDRQHLVPGPLVQTALQPQTPVRKRSLSRNTLHRAVLIRSAQRALLKAETAEKEREEEEEEKEVFGVIASDAGTESDDGSGGEEEREDGSGTEEEEDSNSEDDDDKVDRESQKSTWRRSLERIWPFGSSGARQEEEHDDEFSDEQVQSDSGEEQDENHEQEEQDQHHAPPDPKPHTPTQVHAPVRPLGSFMTPQVHARSKVSASSSIFGRREQGQADGSEQGVSQVMGLEAGARAGRYSLGGGAAQRVVVTEQVWRVRDIVVPLAGEAVASSSSNTGADQRPFMRSGVLGRLEAPETPPVRGRIGRQVVGDEERQVIQERRRSALKEVDMFFGGGAPGMGPVPAGSPYKYNSTSPNKPLGWSPKKLSSSSSSSSSSSISPLKTFSPVKPTTDVKADDEDDDDGLDTRSLLERMKETVDGMKRRRSLVPGAGGAGVPTPARGGLVSKETTTPAWGPRMSFGRGIVTVSPKKNIERLGTTEEEEEEEKENGEENKEGNEEVFSLLRPGVMEEVRAREKSTEEEHLDGVEPVDGPGVLGDKSLMSPVLMVSRPAGEALIVADGPEVNNAVDVAIPKTNGRAGLWRQKKASPMPEGSDDDGPDHVEPKGRPRGGSRSAQTPVAEEEPEEQAEEQREEATTSLPAPPKPTTRRGRKPATELSSEERVESAARALIRRGNRAATAEREEPPAAPSRRGRKPFTAVAEEPSGEEEKAVPAKRGRKAASASAAPSQAEEAEEVVAPVLPTRRGGRKVIETVSEADIAEEPQAAPRRGRTPRTVSHTHKTADRGRDGRENSTGSGGMRRGTRGKPFDVEMIDDENDPLDSIDGGAKEVVATKVKGRRKIAKEEVVAPDDVIEEKAAPAPATRSGRAKSVTAKTPAARSRSAKKAPATAPAAVQLDVDKENTPGSEGSSVVEPEEPVKVRVSRTTKKGPAKVKQEDVEEGPKAAAEPAITRGRVMRATRARTRT